MVSDLESLIESINSADDLLRRMHPEEITPVEFAELKAAWIDHRQETVSILRNNQRTIEQLSRRSLISTVAWILIALAFSLGLTIGGILL